jgi:hypothetical protein
MTVNNNMVPGDAAWGSFIPRSEFDSNQQMPAFYGKNRAADTMAWLHERKWEDVQERFQPRELQLLDRVSKEGAIEELDRRMSDIKADTTNSYNANKQAMDMAYRQYGVGQSQQVGDANARTSQIHQSLSQVDAINRARDDISTRNNNLIAGSGSSVRQTAGV